MKTAKNYETRPTAELVPYAKNARTHSKAQVDQIAESIKRFGFTNPVLIDGSGGIIAGHGRVLAAKKLKMDSVPTLTIDHLTDDEKRAYVLADNKLALNGGWDEAMLAKELKALGAAQFDTSVIGFSPDELNSLLGIEKKGKTDADDVPEVPVNPYSKLGDIWLLGQHRLMCGDSTSTEDVDALMGIGGGCDLVWTDPPYNVAIKGKAGSILNDDMADAEFSSFLAKIYSQYYRIMKAGSAIYVAHADSERANFTQEFKKAGLKLSQILIWVKQSATLSRQDFNWQHEPIIYGWKEGAGHYFCGNFSLTTVIDDDAEIEEMTKSQLVEIVAQIRDRAQPTTVIRHDRPTKSDLHPTMKPVSLVERMVMWSSKRGDVVLDLFGGSGSTLIACEKTERAARLMELDPKYVDVIVRRWQDFTGQKAIHAETGKAFGE